MQTKTVDAVPEFNNKIVEKVKSIPYHTNTWLRTFLAWYRYL